MNRAAPRTINFPRATKNVKGIASRARDGSYRLVLIPEMFQSNTWLRSRRMNQAMRCATRNRRQMRGQTPKASYRARHKRTLRRKGVRG